MSLRDEMAAEELCAEAGVKFQLPHTRKCRVIATDDGCPPSSLTRSRAAKRGSPGIIDTTGDGDLGALAGCEWEFGESKDCPCQPMSLNALLICKETTALKKFIHVSDPDESRHQAKKDFLSEIKRAGVFRHTAAPRFAGGGQPIAGDDEP